MLANIDVQTNDPDSEDFINQVKMLDNLTVFTTDNISVSNSMKKDVEEYIKNSKLEELMRIKDGDQTVNFFILEGKDENHVKELLMFVNGLGDITKNENIFQNSFFKGFILAIDNKIGKFFNTPCLFHFFL